MAAGMKASAKTCPSCKNSIPDGTCGACQSLDFFKEWSAMPRQRFSFLWKKKKKPPHGHFVTCALSCPFPILCGQNGFKKYFPMDDRHPIDPAIDHVDYRAFFTEAAPSVHRSLREWENGSDEPVPHSETCTATWRSDACLFH
eukprot:c12148_g1_i1.p1 GENE.c12148_g1_i1~~c12148_g1_i1.p1  ORF type:complete len:143 (+),score=11.40 c12148_g1_i1:243-671(+)